ncbi:DNA N-6-adenine-methyltransferase [Alkalihalobacillus sp. 1P02AB]|uniref:DNA N-6-adenine-methyltransferase n=1 Tax=Alkalihalobacillus sp. 1P02AB TaxID=3132260 RepID=UPI0039A456D6
MFENVCATELDKKCDRFFSPEQDGLKQSWTGTVWMNPPYQKPEVACNPNCTKKR